jgi:EAL domain-containing protein (putative c-di-GMP-specific phosphodiesterase class I)
LREALEQGCIEVHYQVKGCVATGAITGVEALVRWNHPVRGQVAPVDFVGLAERTSMIASLTDTVVQRVVTDMASGVIPPDWHVSINVSARNLGDSEFPGRLARLVRQSNVPTRRICIEITETALMADPGRAQQALRQLADAGFFLSLDDFGQCYTSLSQLGRLPLQEVKIDRAYVSRAAGSATDAAIVAAVIEIGHSLGLTVVAEGVEETETLSLLQEWGCDGYQGWLLGRPVPAAELTAAAALSSDALALAARAVPQPRSAAADASSTAG